MSLLPDFFNPEQQQPVMGSVAEICQNRITDLLSATNLIEQAVFAKNADDNRRVRLAGTWANKSDFVGSVVGVESDHDRQVAEQAAEVINGDQLGGFTKPFNPKANNEYLKSVVNEGTIDIEQARRNVQNINDAPVLTAKVADELGLENVDPAYIAGTPSYLADLDPDELGLAA
jgi:hypothetical protein